MDSIMVICVVGFVMLAIYKLFELYAKRKERILMIEKLAFMVENKEDNENRLKIRLPFVVDGDSGFGFGSLRISLLLIGIGTGCLFAVFIQIQYPYPRISSELISMIYFASISMFGGIGLLAAYLIEQRKRAQK